MTETAEFDIAAGTEPEAETRREPERSRTYTWSDPVATAAKPPLRATLLNR